MQSAALAPEAVPAARESVARASCPWTSALFAKLPWVSGLHGLEAHATGWPGRHATLGVALALWFLLPMDAHSQDRVQQARLNTGARIRERFAKAGAPYPADTLFLRAFKQEALLELWAQSGHGKFRLVAVYPVLAASGQPGPKRKEGDLQVPEGVYQVDRFNPKSAFHLSLGINYPNAADLVHADPLQPGTDIFIHGSDVSVGCLPLGDAAIEEVYLAAYDSSLAHHLPIRVHIFPARMEGPAWEDFSRNWISGNPGLAEFWAGLKPVYEQFEREHRLPVQTRRP